MSRVDSDPCESVDRHLNVGLALFNPDEMCPLDYRCYGCSAGADEGIEHNSRSRRLDTATRDLDRKGRRMPVTPFNRNLPDICVTANGARTFGVGDGEAELRTANEVNDFIRWDEEARVAVYPATFPPDDLLPHWKIREQPFHGVFDQPVLHAWSMIIENSAVGFYQSAHFSQAVLLKFNVFSALHRIVVFVVPIL